jgi:hypothetical protein
MYEEKTGQKEKRTQRLRITALIRSLHKLSTIVPHECINTTSGTNKGEI